MAIQLIVNREWGLARNENPNQGSFIMKELADVQAHQALVARLQIMSRPRPHACP